MPAWAWILIALFVVCGCGVPILAAILLPVFAQARLTAKRSTAIADAKQVAVGIALYSTDYDTKMPVFNSPQEVSTRLEPYIKGTYRVNGVSEPLYKHAARLSWNQEISGKATSDLNPKSWMFYDPSPFGRNRILAHIDSSVKSYTREEFDSQLTIPLQK